MELYRRVIRPKSPVFCCFIVIIMVMLFVCIGGNIAGFSVYGVSWLPIVVLIITLFLLVYLICLFISLMSKKVIIDDEFIYVAQDRFEKILLSIQHETKIYYNDLSNIFLTFSSNDSRNKAVFGLFTPMMYIVLESKDNKSHAINVYYYTKKQIIEILNEIIHRSQLHGNLIAQESGEKIYDEFKEKNN